MADNKRGNVYLPAQVLMRREGRKVLQDGKKEDLKGFAERYNLEVEGNATVDNLKDSIRNALGMARGAPRTTTTAAATGATARPATPATGGD